MSRRNTQFVTLAVGAALCAALVACDGKTEDKTAGPATAAATDSAARSTANAAAEAALDKAGQPAAAAKGAAKAPAPAAAPTAPAVPSAPAAAKAGDDAATDTGVNVKNTLRDRANATVSDGKSLGEARALVDEMSQEMKRAIAGLMMAKGDKAKVDRISEDFKSLNDGMTKKLERVSAALTPEEMVEFEKYTKEQLGPLMNQLIQAFFQSGGLKVSDGGADAKGQQARVPVGDTPAAGGDTPVVAAGTPTAPPTTPTAAGAAPAAKAAAPAPAAPAAPAAAPAGKVNLDTLPLTMANKKVDDMAKRLKAVVAKIRATEGDPDKLKAVNGEYQAVNREMGSSIPKLRQALSEEQRVAFDAYVKAVLMPIANELVQAFTAAGAVPTKP